MSLLKYFLFLYRSESFKKCLKYIENDWMQVNVNEEREIMLKNAKFGRTISIWCTILMFSGGSGHHFFKPLLSDRILTKMNISVKPYPSPRFIAIVKQHTRVLSYVSQLEMVFSEIFLVEILGCAINLSILGYFAISNWKEGNIANFITYIILINVFIFNIFIYSYIGEMLTIQARKVGETGYLIDWHQLPKNISLDLSFFIQICQFPKKITAGKIVFLSLASFTAIMKSSAAYFNILW
ncbi:odorant receptor 82a-like, partial [Leptopilina boulardi]|uniref:odorant receptor 82a-like n=1 Tax=Leptopilina boulardi TaxID=63433 RepID=UPI0021F56ABA